MLFNRDGQTPGPIIDLQGRVLGEHRGIVHYTVGQRKGLGIGGTAEPLYVIRLDACANTVVVGTQRDCFAPGVMAADLNWIAPEPPAGAVLRVAARIRQQHHEAACQLTMEAQGMATLAFEEPQLSVTPGQTVVFYDGDLVLGSGVIEKAVE